VTVTRGTDNIRELGPGAWFGELALLRDVPRTASVTALTGVSLWTVERVTFLASVAAAPASMELAESHAREHYRWRARRAGVV
jgi:CRP-like cAMP-binding protein